MTGFRSKYQACRHCEGRGEVYGTLTNDPGERARMHSCPDCGGTGCSPYLNNQESKVEDEHDERM